MMPGFYGQGMPYFQQQSYAFTPMMVPQPYMGTGWEGLAMQSPLLGLAGESMYGMFASPGQVYSGFSGTRNMNQVWRARRLQESQMALMQQAAQSDRVAVEQTMLGAASVFDARTGQQWYKDRVSKAVAGMAAIAPTALQFVDPRMLDAMGFSGLAASQSVFAGSQYRYDAATGRYGMSQGSQEAILGQIRNLSGIQGLRGGDLGSMYQEMTARGLVGSSPGSFKGITDPVARQAADAQRVKSMLSEYADAVSAMREIFGDNGNPNAPMREIFNGLEAMTQGAMRQLAPARVGQIVRETYALAQSAGLGMDAVARIQQDAGQMARSLGLNGVFAIGATQDALAFHSAIRNRGAVAGTWGALSPEAMTQARERAVLGAAASMSANRAGAAMRLHDSIGGFAKGSMAEAWAQAVKSGESTFTYNGKQMGVDLTEAEYNQMIQAGGGNTADYRRLLGQRDTNQETIHKYNIGQTIQARQGAELSRDMARYLVGDLNASSAGITGKRGRETSAALARSISAGIMNLSPEEMASPEARREAIKKIIASSVGGLAGVSEAEKQRLLSVYGSDANAEILYGQANRWANQRQGTDLTNVIRANDPETARLTAMQRREAEITGKIETSLAGFGKGGVVQRILGELRRGKNVDVRSLLTAALGSAPKEEVAKALEGQLADLSAQQEAYEDIIRKNPNSPEAKAALEAIQASTKKLIETGAKHGLNLGQSAEDEAKASSPEAQRMRRVTAAAEKLGIKDIDKLRAMAKEDPAALVALAESKGLAEEDIKTLQTDLGHAGVPEGGQGGTAKPGATDITVRGTVRIEGDQLHFENTQGSTQGASV